MCTHDVSMLYSPSDINCVGGTVNLGERPKQNRKALPPPILSLLHAPPSALGCRKPCCQHHPPTRTHTGTQSMTAFTLWDALDFLCFMLRSSLPSPFYGVSRADLSQGARGQFVRFQNFNSPESDKFRGYIFNLRILFCSSYLPGHFWQYLVPSSYTQYLLSF